MKKTLVMLLCLSMSYFLMAQESTKQREVGLIFRDFDSFGLSYKTGTNKALWRFNSLIGSGYNTEQTSDDQIVKQDNLQLSFNAGKEYRTALSKNLELRYGADLSFSYYKEKFEIDTKSINNYHQSSEDKRYTPGINLVFGFNYLINDKLLLGAEILPYFSYTIGTSEDLYNGNKTEADLSGFSYGISNSSIRLSLAYRF